MSNRDQTACHRRRRKAERPLEIVEAALQLFLTHGYAATRLDDVAALARIGKGTLYLYFKSKEQLFLSVVEHSAKCQIERALTMITEHQGSTESLLRHLLTTWWDSILSQTTGGLLKIVIAESANFPTIAHFYLRAVVAPLKTALADAIRRGIARKEFRSMDADAVSRVPLSNLLMLALWKQTFENSDPSKDLPQALETTLDVCLFGLTRQACP